MEYIFSIVTANRQGLTSVILVGISFVLVFLLSKPMSAYQLGENYARSMGVNIKLFRTCLILLSSVLSATVTAFAGPISFVGIAVPHLIKRALNTSKPIVVIPGCFLGGAVFCMFCDLIARTAFAPSELNISTVTSIFGAPVVIAMMIKRQKEKQ
ncbi:MAG: iron chelate uptake ABC transporter family permease subunit [Firmicutes bacterium]|nr:iron chelate uptake ABC transporter family permease subunit [Bacillota bacterium]